jgi:methylmalonyl-CoA mutase N-terminal domain/subunit
MDKTSRKKNIDDGYDRWLKEFEDSGPDKNWKFMTVSSKPIRPLYAPKDVENIDFDRDIGYPGQFPYTRGVHASMYRRKIWTMRQFSGFGSPAQTNERYHFLLKRGQMGLSVAFDLPTLMGYDSDSLRSVGEVGVCGVAVDTLNDMEIIFNGLDLGKISTSMTINCTSTILLAMYIAVAEKQGVPSQQLTGTLQNDILKEYIAQKEWIYPPEPSIRLITDMMAFCAQHVPKWNTISISGYHIREAGATAAQELAFTLADGFTYVEAALAAGMDVDTFAPRLSFFFNSHLDFFEEIAKYRAARRIWARHMRDKYKAKDPRSWLMRFHTQTAGCSLTAQQPENNIVRTAFQALAGVLGGTQSLHTNSMDETYALPTEHAVKLALRTQQLIAYETGVHNTIDPLAGSYFVEALTNELEAEAECYFDEIEKRGGVLKCIDQAYLQRELADSAYRFQKEIENKERIIVGVNDFIEQDEDVKIPLLKIDQTVERDQIASLNKIKESRDNDRVKTSLAALKKSVKAGENHMPPLLDCIRCYTTEEEITSVLTEVFGTYTEPPII